MRRRSRREVVAEPPPAWLGRDPGATLVDQLANPPQVFRPSRDPAVERRLGEVLGDRAAERGENAERAAMAFDDPGCPREPEPPAQGWRDWWLPDDER